MYNLSSFGLIFSFKIFSPKQKQNTSSYHCSVLKLLHEKIYDKFIAQLIEVYKQVKIGDPLEPGITMGPLHTKAAVEEFVMGLKVEQYSFSMRTLCVVISKLDYSDVLFFFVWCRKCKHKEEKFSLVDTY